jgi:hypothetical protein
MDGWTPHYLLNRFDRFNSDSILKSLYISWWFPLDMEISVLEVGALQMGPRT